jgi:glycosyltransferase involved in cell wall biosynthesis
LRIGVWGELSDEKFVSKFLPLLQTSFISELILIRFTGNPLPTNKIKVIHLTHSFRKSKRVYELLSFIKLFYSCLNKKIDILIGVYFIPHGIYISLLSKLFKIPSIQVLPGTDLYYIKKQKILLKLLDSASIIAVRGSISKKSLISSGIEEQKVIVLDNFIESLPPKQNIISLHKEYDLIFVGYFRKLKRLDLLIKIIAKLKECKSDISAVFVGDGPEMLSIKEQINCNMLEKHIHIVGFDSNPGQWYLRSKIFVLTSKSEGLNMAMVEAMSYGLPVVVSNVNDLEDVVKNEINGYLVNFGNVELFAEKIINLLTDDKLYRSISKNAIKRIEHLYLTQYSYTAVTEQWNQILKRIS